MRAYEPIFSRPAARLLKVMRRGAFAEIELAIDRICNRPHGSGDLTEPTDDGRQLQIRFLRHYALFYWIDDASREVRFVRIEPLGR